MAPARQADQRAVLPERWPGRLDARVLGDIVIAFETAAKEAAEADKPLKRSCRASDGRTVFCI